MLQALAAGILGLEEVLATIGTASIAADSVVFLNAVRVGRFVPRAIKASSRVRSSWVVATKIANNIDSVLSHQAYTDMRAMVHEMTVIIDEINEAQYNYNNGCETITATAAKMRDEAIYGPASKPKSDNTKKEEEGPKAPLTVTLGTKGKEGSETILLGASLDSINGPAILKRLLATYVGKRLISKMSGHMLSKVETLSLLEAQVSRYLAKHLFVADFSKSAATKFDNLAKSWAGEVYPDRKLDASTSRALLFAEFGFYPAKYRSKKTPLSNVEVTEADYQRFCYLAWRNAFDTYFKLAEILGSNKDSNLNSPGEFVVFRPATY